MILTQVLPTVQPRTSAPVVYTPELGPFVPRRIPATGGAVYAERVRYAGHGRHHVRPTRAPGAWLLSALRDFADAVVGSFRFLAA